MEIRIWTIVCVLGSLVNALNNGLARTPPMGWTNWQRFRCEVDCESYPDNCINEELYLSMAQALVDGGYKELGYEYINIDDCWMTRLPNGKLAPDPKRFPHGIKYIADKIHALGLKFGIYEDFGKTTCAGYPGSEFYLKPDAETLVSWGIDFLMLDGCNSDIADMPIGYPLMGKFLNQTGRPVLYSCSWPAYVVLVEHKVPDYKTIAEHCNIWRNYDDIQDSWASVVKIINFYAQNAGDFRSIAAPGSFNHPDMLILGNFGLSYTQERCQMAMWAIFTGPLFMSNDLRKIRPESKALLQNKGLIAINQDPLGIQGRLVNTMNNVQIWHKPILPKGSAAVAILNLNDGGPGLNISLTSAEMDLIDITGYSLTDAFTGKFYGNFSITKHLNFYIYPSDIFLGVATKRPL